ncbi:DNA primase catalytic subunit PriS [Candidatus Micrarchaeota archaeon]|nr:DNA primase catalytic subunit PriS [Candidatus Micrarchaeota archaeon]
MNAADATLARKIFASYYETAEFRIPMLEQREFGIGNQKKIDARHLNFANAQEFRNYLCNNTPLFVSHSTAYYDFPGASPMVKKCWRGADVVFDLDIHAEGRFGAYAHLASVKEDVIRLVNDFILNDFGISRENVAVAFSGNRGYHVHVRDPAFLPLGSDERHELVDYIMGQGLDYTQFFTPEGKPAKLIGPRPDEGGYRGRLARGTIKLLEEDPGQLSRLFTKEKERNFFISGIKEGNWSRTSLKPNDLVSRLKPLAAGLPVGSVDTDAGVTQDLSKLIRVPNSIHGDTGMVARIINNIDAFDPWKDAMMREAGGGGIGDMKIRFTEDVPAIEMDQTMGPFNKDDELALPRHYALFFVLKGSATLAGPTG